jgi:hypothetical protein
MTRYIIHFFGALYTNSIHAPNIEEAMNRAMEKYDNVSHVEEA